ncbi:MAG: RagB/SusD family nutrient uptake outer membrane protein, partial [Candidatus Symbiothrix sp.]|nr:RagB/SusD family nutrient uptake outer membrane protein [Candidatus Symbiothrix sp.]
MKKSLKNLALIALLSLALAACDDSGNGENTDNTGIKTEAEASALVNAAYVPLQWLSSYNTFFADGLTEVAAAVYDEAATPVKITRLDIDEYNDVVIELFSDPYTSIGAANLAIKEIEAAPVNGNLTQAQKNYQIARAKFIRGHSYFKLVQTFGEVPIILDSDAIVGERVPIDDVYAQAVKDLTEAAEHLPEYDAQKSNPSKAAVNTILAKLYLTWGQIPVTKAEIQSIANEQIDPTKPEPNIAKLQKAVEYANEVIAKTQYRLLENFNDIWGVNHENNAEVIFSVRHDGDDIDGIAGGMGNHQTHCGFTWPKQA